MYKKIFRAKRIDNDEWVKGYLIQTGSYESNDRKSYIYDDTVIKEFGSAESGYCARAFQTYEVYDETICKYTGATTIWNQDVYEDDIIKYQECASYQAIGIVEWRGCAYHIRWISPYAKNYRTDLAWWLENRDMRVIGDVFNISKLPKNFQHIIEGYDGIKKHNE